MVPVVSYEEKHKGCRVLQPRLLWKHEFLRCFLGCLTREHLQDLSREIDEISGMNQNFTSWSVRPRRLSQQPFGMTTRSSWAASWRLQLRTFTLIRGYDALRKNLFGPVHNGEWKVRLFRASRDWDLGNRALYFWRF